MLHFPKTCPSRGTGASNGMEDARIAGWIDLADIQSINIIEQSQMAIAEVASPESHLYPGWWRIQV